MRVADHPGRVPGSRQARMTLGSRQAQVRPRKPHLRRRACRSRRHRGSRSAAPGCRRAPAARAAGWAAAARPASRAPGWAARARRRPAARPGAPATARRRPRRTACTGRPAPARVFVTSIRRRTCAGLPTSRGHTAPWPRPLLHGTCAAPPELAPLHPVTGPAGQPLERPRAQTGCFARCAVRPILSQTTLSQTTGKVTPATCAESLRRTGAACRNAYGRLGSSSAMPGR